MLCGDRDRDPLQVDDYSFAASSRATYMASMLCFAAVMGDACMVPYSRTEGSSHTPCTHPFAPARLSARTRACAAAALDEAAQRGILSRAEL